MQKSGGNSDSNSSSGSGKGNDAVRLEIDMSGAEGSDDCAYVHQSYYLLLQQASAAADSTAAQKRHFQQFSDSFVSTNSATAQVAIITPFFLPL